MRCRSALSDSELRIFENFRGGEIMANIKSAKKRILVIEKRTLENKIAMTKLKTVIKKFNAAVESGDKEAAKAAYLVAVKRIDQAAARGLIHKNKAAHKKSQFTKALNAMA